MVETVLALSKITVRVLVEIEGMIRIRNGVLQVPEDRIDPGKAFHFSAFTPFACESDLKFDPASASNPDPPDLYRANIPSLLFYAGSAWTRMEGHVRRRLTSKYGNAAAIMVQGISLASLIVWRDLLVSFLRLFIGWQAPEGDLRRNEDQGEVLRPLGELASGEGLPAGV